MKSEVALVWLPCTSKCSFVGCLRRRRRRRRRCLCRCVRWWNGIRWVTKSTRVPISIDPESAWMTGTFPRRRQPRLLSAYSLFSNRTSCFRQRSIHDRRVLRVSRIPLLSYPIISLISAFLSHLYGTLPHHFGAD